MRCPKCQYISYDSPERCRNCGYELSLAVERPAADVDVTIRREELPSGRLHDASHSALDAPLAPAASVDFPGDNDDQEPRVAGAGDRLRAANDLPLFTDRVADDQAPLITPPARPRSPLSVRRTASSGRDRMAVGSSELPLELGDDREEAEERDGGDPQRLGALAAASDVAGLARRLGAGLIDVTVLGAIGTAVLYLTLRLCALTLAEWRLLPALPFIAFMLFIVGAYLVLFTAAGGQTIGKMATRIRVVASGGGRRVPLGAAVVRALSCLVSTALLGAGFLPVLFTADRRAFHDRMAETRVVTV